MTVKLPGTDYDVHEDCRSDWKSEMSGLFIGQTPAQERGLTPTKECQHDDEPGLELLYRRSA